MDLSLIDPTAPANTELARLGAGRIRDIEQATITSFGLEHDLTGPHTIPRGPTSSRPANGFPGRLYINTDLNATEYDNGAQWLTLGGGITVFEQKDVTPNLTGIAAPTVICQLPALLSIRRVLLFGSAAVSVVNLSGQSILSLIWTRNITVVKQVDYIVDGTSVQIPIPVPSFLDNPGVGTFIYSLTASISANTFRTSANPGTLFAAAMA